MVKQKGKKLLPRIYVNQDVDIKKSIFNGNFKVSVRKLMKLFGQGSGIIMRISELIDEQTWKSAWPLSVPDGNSWYIIERIYWKSIKGNYKAHAANQNLDTSGEVP